MIILWRYCNIYDCLGAGSAVVVGFSFTEMHGWQTRVHQVYQIYGISAVTTAYFGAHSNPGIMLDSQKNVMPLRLLIQLHT